VQLQLQGGGANARLVEVPAQAGTASQSAAAPQAAAAGAKPVLTLITQPQQAASLQQVVAQSAQSAVTRQDGMGPLLASLTGLDGKLAAMPRPVVEAAAALLATRLNLNGKPLDGAGLKDALMRSGTLYESGLRNAAAPATLQGDIKGGLLALRSALAGWLGGEAAASSRSVRRPPPPAKGAIPRAEPPAPSPLSPHAGAKDAARLLLSQTEAVLARVRLTQISSLPETAPRAGGEARPAGEWHFELPLLWGGEQSMANFRISRDGGGGQDRQERGWEMRFSINFSAIGEVDAHLTLRGKRAAVMLWAEREETAAALESLLPELGDALEAKGLVPGALRVKRGVPEAAARPAGHFMDGRS
jgi:hypothetical protein